MTRLLRAAPLAAALAATLAIAARPARADDAEEKAKLEAKALLQSGNAFFDKQAYSQALDLFRAAYARYPSTKLLFNIGRTLDAMGRPREAAVTFDAYLSKPDADPARRDEILAMLRRLEPKLGKLVFRNVDAKTAISIDGEALGVSGAPARVDPGDHLVRIIKPGFLSVDLTVSVGAGEEKNVDVKLAPAPPADPQPTQIAVRTQPQPDGRAVPEVAARPAPPVVVARVDGPGGADRIDTPAGPDASAPPTRLAFTVRGVFDQQLAGAAAQPGLEVTLHPRLSLVAAATVGPTFGGFVGARARILTGRLRPLVTVGAPIFAFDGVRFGVRGAAGVEAGLAGRWSASFELGVEHYFVQDTDMREATVLAPVVALNAGLF